MNNYEKREISALLNKVLCEPINLELKKEIELEMNKYKITYKFDGICQECPYSVKDDADYAIRSSTFDVVICNFTKRKRHGKWNCCIEKQS